MEVHKKLITKINSTLEVVVQAAAQASHPSSDEVLTHSHIFSGLGGTPLAALSIKSAFCQPCQGHCKEWPSELPAKTPFSWVYHGMFPWNTNKILQFSNWPELTSDFTLSLSRIKKLPITNHCPEWGLPGAALPVSGGGCSLAVVISNVPPLLRSCIFPRAAQGKHIALVPYLKMCCKLLRTW